MVYAPTVIDVSRLAVPAAIETLDYEALLADYRQRFLARWDELRQSDPTLPAYDTLALETDPAAVLGQVWTSHRLLDRQRVNDAFKALLAVQAKGSNLDSIVAGRNIERRTIVPATPTSAAIVESDSALLRRYLLSFDSPAAGSAGRYLFDAWSAWPQSEDKELGLWDARVNGRAVHGRRGDTDLVLIGPAGRLPTSQELAIVRTAVASPDRAPEAAAISVMSATRVEYQVSLVIEVPGEGPSPDAVRAEAEARIRAAAMDRILIGGEVPQGLLAGAAYGPNVISVRDLSPVIIPASPYSVPVMSALSIVHEVRS